MRAQGWLWRLVVNFVPCSVLHRYRTDSGLLRLVTYASDPRQLRRCKVVVLEECECQLVERSESCVKLDIA